MTLLSVFGRGLCVAAFYIERSPQNAESAFTLAVAQTTEVARSLLHSLVTDAPPRDRAAEAAKRRAKAAVRFGKDSRQTDLNAK